MLPWIMPVKPLDWDVPRLSDKELQERLEREFGRAPYPEDMDLPEDFTPDVDYPLSGDWLVRAFYTLFTPTDREESRVGYRP